MRSPVSHPLALARLRDAQLEDGSLSPLAAAIAIATHHQPSLLVSDVVDTLTNFALEVRSMIGKGTPSPTIAGIANYVLFTEHGFMGNPEHYTDPDNSYIDCVLKRRTGLPILLSLVYVETVLRAGGIAHGIGLPGHFIAAVEEDGVLTFVDPFNGGKQVTAEECRSVVAASGVKWTDDYLLPVEGRQWTLRMLANLRNLYAQIPDPANMAAVCEQMLLVAPTLPGLQEELTRLHKLLDDAAARNN